MVKFGPYSGGLVISRFAIAFWCLALLPAQLMGAAIMVNEYYNGSGLVGPGTKMVSDEFIEFVIVQESTAASLASLSFGDSNEATSQLQAVFHFDQATLQQALDNAHLSAFLPGTMIVVKGTDLGAQSIAYDPLNGNWDIQLVAGQGAVGSTGTKINGDISVGNKGDTVWISSTLPVRNSDTSGFISAIGHTSAPGLIANTVASVFGSENILPTTIPTGTAVANVGDTTVSLATTTTPTMGTPNGGQNSIWIDGLRSMGLAAAPEPSRSVLLLGSSAAFIFRRQRKGGLRA